MTVIQAIFENGVFRPTEPVNLPEKSRVELKVSEPTDRQAAGQRERARKKTIEILSRSYATGQTDTAARHNEHQP